jgi:hypothetical protein
MSEVKEIETQSPSIINNNNLEKISKMRLVSHGLWNSYYTRQEITFPETILLLCIKEYYE